MDTPALPPFAIGFDGLSWRERSAWRNSRVRALERIDASLRLRLEAFGDGQGALSEVLEDLARMQRWIDQLRAECEAIDGFRVRSPPPA